MAGSPCAAACSLLDRDLHLILNIKNFRVPSSFGHLRCELSFPDGFCWPLSIPAPACYCGFREGREILA